MFDFGRALLLAAALAWGALCSAQPSSIKGTITGKVLDEDGDPLSGWGVVAGRWNYHHGRKEFQVLPRETRTESDGSFALEDLDPGEYCIRAQNPYLAVLDLQFVALNLPQLPAPKKSGEIYVTTYYPAGVDVTAASSILVAAGRETSGINFRVQAARVFSIRGTTNLGAGPMSIHQADSFAPGDRRAIFGSPDGTFEVARLLPGSYVIDWSNPQAAGRVTVTITDHDLNDVTIGPRACPQVKGKVTVDGLPEAFSAADERLVSFSQFDEAVAVFGEIGTGGTFSVACVQPGRYTAGVPLGPGVYLKSIRLDGRSIAGGPIDLTAAGDKNIDIALSTRAAEVRGAVRNATSGKPLAAVEVTLWSADDDFNVTTTSAADGTFHFVNLAPGNYRLAAWDQLYPQEPDWGIQTMPEFRKSLEGLATRVTLSESQREEVDPTLVLPEAIEQTASRLHLYPIMKTSAEVDAIAMAAKSPEALAHFLESNRTVDWKLLRSALGLSESGFFLEPCGGDVPAADSPCSTEIETAPQPAQEILVVRGGQLSYTVEFLRYLRDSNGSWQFAGEFNAFQKNSPSHHRFVQVGNKPFLVISSDHSQNGIATQQILEDWFDLTRPEFDPVFSATVEGSQGRFGFGVGRTLHAQYAVGQAGDIERIELTLDMRFDGEGLDQPATYVGVYERHPNEKMFTLRAAYSDAARRQMISVMDFEELADPFSELSNEKLLTYALPGLRKIATGSDANAKDWLRSILNQAMDTPEKRTLMGLLAR